MQKQKIYIVVRSSRAAVYGIGTYQAQIIESLKIAKVEFGIIELFSQVDTLTVEQKDGYELISVPFKNGGNSQKRAEYYSRNIAYLLRELIPDEKGCKLVFHLNFMSDPTLVVHLKRLFKCKVILTIHYTDWSFELLGDTKRLDKILSEKKRNLDIQKRRIRQSFWMDIKMARRCDHVVYIAKHSAHTLSKYIKAKNESIVYNASGGATIGSVAAASQLQTPLKLRAKPELPAGARYVRREAGSRVSDFRVTRTITLLPLSSRGGGALVAATLRPKAELSRVKRLKA
jgi:hypothetical protein